MPQTLTRPAAWSSSSSASSPAASGITAGGQPELDAIAFPDGIPGFEACRRFVLLSSDTAAPLRRLDAVAGPEASFLCIDPRRVVPGYACTPGPADIRRLDTTEPARLLWLVLVTVETDGTVVANLRAPIAINPDRMLGCQVVPNDSAYAIRHVMVRPEP